MTVHSPARRVHLALRAALIAWLGCGLAQPASASQDVRLIRVRSDDPSLTALIDRAAGHSATFQRLVATIQGSNGIVHVVVGKCGHGVRACLKMWMVTVGPNRYLRVIIDRRKGDSDVDVMGSIGHELQHAVEALSESGAIDSRGLHSFFFNLAATDDKFRFETAAATHAGDDIRRELRRR